MDFDKAIASLKEKYGTKVTVLQLPIGQGLNFKGIFDVIEMKAYGFDGKKMKEIDAPDDVKAQAEEIREAIIENAAENDEALMEKFFEGEELTKEDILKGLKVGIAEGDVVPVFLARLLRPWVFRCCWTTSSVLPSPIRKSALPAKR